MKQITLKTILIIDGREYPVGSQDLSDSIAEYEKAQEHELDDEEILEYILDEE